MIAFGGKSFAPRTLLCVLGKVRADTQVCSAGTHHIIYRSKCVMLMREISSFDSPNVGYGSATNSHSFAIPGIVKGESESVLPTAICCFRITAPVRDGVRLSNGNISLH